MQTRFSEEQLQDPLLKEADEILRSCVHCGFCNAVCPTYREIAGELDGPRGRIYLVKELLEQDATSANAQKRSVLKHVDRCLTCRACETTCPSGVQYVRLMDIGRRYLSERLLYPGYRRVLNWFLSSLIPYANRMAFLIRAGRLFRWLLPKRVAVLLGEKSRFAGLSLQTGPVRGKVLLLDGCVQGVSTPGVNDALVYLLSFSGIQAERLASDVCCGAVDHHLPRQDQALKQMKRLIDCLWPHIDPATRGKDFLGIVSSASGCGLTIRDYPSFFKDDVHYKHKAEVLAGCLKDASEVVSPKVIPRQSSRIALHIPCTLKHGSSLHGLNLEEHLQDLLQDMGHELVAIAESDQCCGSAGTYSIFHPSIAAQLRQKKLDGLTAHSPEVIVTANIGCQLHLQGGDQHIGKGRNAIPVMHWIEWVASCASIASGSVSSDVESKEKKRDGQ